MTDFATQYANAEAWIDRCQHDNRHTLTDGRQVCSACHLAYHRRMKAIRKAELAARPRCEACGRRRGTIRSCGVLLCGTCFHTAERNLPQFGLFGTIVLSRDHLLELAQGR